MMLLKVWEIFVFLAGVCSRDATAKPAWMLLRRPAKKINFYHA